MGSGKLAVVANTVAASYVDLNGCGSGHTFVAVKTNANITDDIKVHMNSSGSVSVMSDAMRTGRLCSHVAGSGSVEINTLSQFFAGEIESQVTGSGTLQVVGQGTTERHHITITGSGTLNASISATSSDVYITGSGCANLNDLHGVSSKVAGSGSIQRLTLVRLDPPYDVMALPVPAPTSVAEWTSPGNWLKKAIFG
ncbi:hypothetical protein H310_10703 [Aphanomyces invadans]|nr:hypothetical protein H310_10703 [Aphanomyces invadans]ETV96057.1 hypothetical protein H310_10703 [Aphanomyces invadans]|eukprot:XP_008875368.1 hypothetical protein H310_10703 [Aphanomyces invadans]